MAVVLQHFSHEHPLVLVRRRLVRNDEEENDQQSIICYACQQPILFSTTTISSGSSPDYCYYYSCQTCTYRLHKKCAELPHGVKHPKHPQHPLTLLAHPPRYYQDCRCNVCRKSGWKWFVYHCAECKFDAHVTCTPLEERPNKHKFHDHPLTFTQRPSSFFCDACGAEGEDLSYRCTNTSCQFLIHDSCASSPNTIKRKDHHHPLQLAYYIPYSKEKFDHECYICNKAVHPNYWVYYCASCTYFAHLKCGISEEDSSALSDTISSIENLDPDVIRVPMPGLMTQIFSMNKSFIYNENINRIGCPNGHLEALIDDDVDRKKELRKKKKEILCDVCVQPISISSDPISNCGECSFIAHTRCTLFKSQILHPSHPQHPLTLMFHSWSTFGIRYCNMCNGDTNGFYFSCNTCANFGIDVGCATTFLPSKIKHDSHNHPLTLQTGDGHSQYCKACGERISTFVMKYACDSSIGCDYRLHTYCAMLPGTLEHDWDKHHMSLTFPPFDHPEDYFCETCEEDIHPTHWLYHCSKCDHSFHTDCAHPHKDWSKFKFGITYKFEHHEHNLTLVRRPKKSRPCEMCGRLDPNYPRLDCASCSFHICYICAHLFMRESKRIN